MPVTRTPCLILSLALVMACSQDSPPPIVRHLDRPVDVAFGCRGAANANDTVGQALPTSGCAPRAPMPDADTTPMPDAGPSTPDAERERPGAAMYGFVVESTRGTVAIVRLAGEASVFIDSDPLTPGFSGVPVGRLPVEIATSPDGCWMTTANEGSCDLGVLDVFRAVEAETNVVTRLQINAAGGTLVAAPTSIVTRPTIATDDSLGRCPLAPEGVAYVALPGCDVVVMVDLATGDVIEGVRFPASGIPELTGTAIECSLECLDPGGAAVPAVPPMPGGTPQTLSMAPDGSRLYVGLWDESAMAVIELDAAGVPTTVNKVALEGAIGVRQIDATGEVIMGNGLAGTPFRFAYMLGRDNAIHVVDVTNPQTLRECDTQIDPRYVHDENNPSVLACLPVGSFPRRMTANGPGQRLPFGASPRDIEVVHTTLAAAAPEPARLNGTFVMVTAEHPFRNPRGVVFYITVDDEDAEDFELPGDPAATDLALVMPHTLRDTVTNRNADPPVDCGTGDGNAIAGQARLLLAPRLGETSFRLASNLRARPDLNAGVFDLHDQRLVPSLHRSETCLTDDGATVAIWSLGAAQSPDERERVFPDLVSTLNEEWTVAWEGLLARRLGGTFNVGPARITLADQAGLFCEAGFELYDQISIGGCDRSFDCAVDEVCVVHPEKPTFVPAVCVPAGQETRYVNLCREFMISARIYNAVSVKQNEVELVSAPFVIPYTPIDGCSDDAQCDMLGEKHLEDLQYDPFRETPLRPEDVLEYSRAVCATDPTFEGIKKCVLACDMDSECVLGSVCQGGRCVLGPHAPAECMAGVRPYNLSASSSFVVSGSASGYLHPWIVGNNKECIVNPLAHPLANGRVRFDAPMCPDNDPLSLSPNICQLELGEPVQLCTSRDSETGDCSSADTDPWSTRISHGMRIITPGPTLEITDIYMDSPFTPGDRLMPAPSRYEVAVPIGGGYIERNAHLFQSNGLGAHVPGRIRMAPRGTLYVIDSGDSGLVGGTLGQIFEIRVQVGDTGLVVDSLN